MMTSSKESGKRTDKRIRGYHEEMFKETDYYFKDGLRWVFPYSFTFTAHVKGRWMELALLDVFKREFHMETEEYYRKAIRCGKIRVNNEIVDMSRQLRAKDILTTQVHRHEPPVVEQQFEFLQNGTDMVVINKPSSIPVHPCGRYRHNTVVFILGKEHALSKLHTIHRIDRLTSGILMFAKTPEKAREMEHAIKNRLVEKEYLARVCGEFPCEVVEINEPIETVSHKIGFCRVSKEGKACSTSFRRISYNGKSSVVQCSPRTGRMHQIRVHLQYAGHPIVNDPIYNHPTAWGVHRDRKGGELDMQKVMGELIRSREDFEDVSLPPCKRAKLNDEIYYTSKDIGEGYFDGDCSDCKRSWKQPTKSDLVMYLHALHYKGPGWEYKTEVPHWAKDNWFDDVD